MVKSYLFNAHLLYLIVFFTRPLLSKSQGLVNPGIPVCSDDRSKLNLRVWGEKSLEVGHRCPNRRQGPGTAWDSEEAPGRPGSRPLVTQVNVITKVLVKKSETLTSELRTLY